MDGPQPKGRLKMPVQMTELEEVVMVEVCDEALEAVVGRSSWGSIMTRCTMWEV